MPEEKLRVLVQEAQGEGARLTTRQRDLLHHQLSDTAWLTPMMMGGTDGSHHSSTLAQLFRRGLVARSNRGGHTRNVWQYRRTRAGKKAVDG